MFYCPVRESVFSVREQTEAAGMMMHSHHGSRQYPVCLGLKLCEAMTSHSDSVLWELG